MTGVIGPNPVSNPDLFAGTHGMLSGKRIALVGFSAAMTAELARVITDAEGFTRPFPAAQVHPAAEVLKPFELILVDVDSAAGTGWLEGKELACVGERTIAVGQLLVLLKLAARAEIAFREYWPCEARAEGLLLRCVLALRSLTPVGRQTTIAKGSTVVLADDDPSITGLVRRVFDRNGMTCEVAATGAEAMASITRLKPCAAVLDVHMPGMDGFEVLSRMKSIAELAPTRVILLTGCEQEADVIRGFSLGADDYVCKPFNPMELTIRLMRVIGRI
jgi:CheY-like chemotaxis protein